VHCKVAFLSAAVFYGTDDRLGHAVAVSRRGTVLPRYFIDIRSRFGRDEDLEGIDLPDTDAALEEALAVACTLKERWSAVPPDSRKDIAIEVVDEAGLTVLTVPFWQIEIAESLERLHKARRRSIDAFKEVSAAYWNSSEDATRALALEGDGI
jgi:hypothetical protein